MADFRVSYAKEADLLAYAKTIGWVDEKGRIVAIGELPDASGGFFLTGAFRRPVPTGRTIKDAFGNDTAEMTDDGLNWRTLRINGNNPFAGDSPLPLPTNGVTVWPPVMEGNPDYVQPVVAVIA